MLGCAAQLITLLAFAIGESRSLQNRTVLPTPTWPPVRGGELVLGLTNSSEGRQGTSETGSYQ